MFMYFTIQSNIAIAIICLIGFIRIKNGQKISLTWQIIKLVGSVSITLTGMVFCFVLAPTMGDSAWNVKNILTHVVVPIVSVADMFLVSNLFNIPKKSVLYVIIPPILYAIYARIAYINGWEFANGKIYPYFFLNWGSDAGTWGFTSSLPFMGTGWWILALFFFLIIVGYVYLTIVDIIRKNLFL